MLEEKSRKNARGKWKGVYTSKKSIEKEYDRPMANAKMKIEEDKECLKKIEEDENHIFYVWKLDLVYNKIYNLFLL